MTDYGGSMRGRFQNKQILSEKQLIYGKKAFACKWLLMVGKAKLSVER